jgi:hypothetical protein
MKKFLFLTVMALLSLAEAQGQDIVRIDTVIEPYFEFDYRQWFESDTSHPIAYHHTPFMTLGGVPQVPFPHLLDSVLHSARYVRDYVKELSGEQVQYNYIEGGATIHGIVAWSYPRLNPEGLENYPMNDLLLYDAMPDTLILLEQVPLSDFSPSYTHPRFPVRHLVANSCDGAVGLVTNDPHYGDQYVLFDKPVRVADSFYVGATQKRLEALAARNWAVAVSRGAGSEIPPFPDNDRRWDYIAMSDFGTSHDSTCWPPPIKMKQRWTLPESLTTFFDTCSFWSDPFRYQPPVGYTVNQWIDRYELDFFMIVPLIEAYDTLWDYELPACPRVEWFNVTDQRGDTTVLRWQSADATHREWQLSYGPRGSEPDDGTFVTCRGTSWRHIDSLHTGDSMSAWVRTVCRDEDYLRYGDWSHEVTWGGQPAPLWTGQPFGNVRLDGLVRLSPNPAHGRVEVASAYRLTGVEVYSMDGRQRYRADAQGLACTFSVEGWPQGSYIVLVQTASGTSTKKLLVRP